MNMKSRIAILAAVTSAGCSVRVETYEAWREPLGPADMASLHSMSGEEPGQWEKIVVRVSRDGLARALQIESTINIDLFDCNDHRRRFPSIAFLNELPLDEQQTAAAGQIHSVETDVNVHGYAPTGFVRRVQSLCAQLSGGSYLGIRTTSDVTRVRL